MSKLSFFIALFPIFLIKSLWAVPAAIIEKDDVYDISSSIEWFIDDGGRFDADDIAAGRLEDFFNRPPKKILNLGHISHPIWCKFTVQSQIPEDLYLGIKNPNIDSLSVYVFDRDGNLVFSQSTGNYVPGHQREIHRNDFFFNLHTGPREVYTVYLRTRSMKSSLYFPMYLGPLKVFFNDSNREDALGAMYFGFILFIFIYNLFLFLILRRPEHFYFSAFIFFLGLMFAVESGYAIRFFWGDQTWLNRYSTVYAALASIFIILFSSALFKSKEKTPRRHILILALMGISILSVVLELLGASLVAYQFLLYDGILTFIFILSITITSMRNGFKPAGYFLIAWSCFLAGILIYILRDADFVPITPFTSHAFQIGSTFTIVLISFALGKKINLYIDKRDEAWQLVASTAEENERLIKHQNQLLEERVNQRTRDLKQTVHTLKQQEEELKIANQFKDRVFSMISHDLKSPLSTLDGMLNVLQTADLTKSEKTKIIKNLRLSLNNTHDILDNILEWATRRHPVDKTIREFDLHSVVNDMINLFSVQLEMKSIKLTNQVPENTRVRADKNMIQLVLRNLISNAIKFTEEGGAISVSTEDTASDFGIRVTDTGIGMSKEDQEKLFNSKNHFTTRGTNNEKGTGLGLLLCKEFVDKNGGTIELSSRKGEGTTFLIKLQKEKKEIGKEEERLTLVSQ